MSFTKHLLFNLTNLTRKNGFFINGVGMYDGTGSSVSSVGDVNDDGISDIIKSNR